MKEKIINVIVVVGMVIVANYPLYNSLKGTANDVSVMIESMREEVAVWKHEIEGTKDKLESVRNEIIGTIDKSLSQTTDVLNRIDEIDSDIDGIINSIDNIKFDASSKIDSIKAQPINTVKDLLKIRG